ncbi:MAG TPA: methyltransferase domain-containing protein [Acidobacteriaceae bacterium]|jgi:tRNA (cmo5U34)-methyltransferase|nr:methyltransferase domain-containing protein [Acidobacteriaceae bacterium]
MRANRSKQVFDATASTYDNDRSRLIPGCDTFYRWAIDLIPPRAKVILDLGAGSGLLTVLIRQRFPQACIHLIDFSGPMLDLARQRMGNDPNVVFHQADYLKQSLPQQLCAIVTSLSIHHIDDADKLPLFAKAHAALKPNGRFINADQVAGPSATLDATYKALWLEQVRANGASEQQIADSLFRKQEDRCASVELQMAWMRAAGFADVDCWYKDNCFAVMAGTKN